jgi:hypothetical protein
MLAFIFSERRVHTILEYGPSDMEYRTTEQKLKDYFLASLCTV